MEGYKQTTEFTGAAAALAMVINHFKPSFALSKENEFRIWMYSVNLPTRACSIYGLAGFARDLGLDVRVVVGKKEYGYPDYRFKGYKKDEIEAAKYTSDIRFADNQGKYEIEVRDFELKEVDELLKQKKIIMFKLIS